MKWEWVEIDKKALKSAKRGSANVYTGNGTEVWRNQMGFSRLIKNHGGKSYMSDRYFVSIREAIEEAKNGPGS